MADIVYMNISDLTEIDSAKPGTFAAVETDKQGKKIDLSKFASKTEVNTGLAEKQDTISDLKEIREGAVAGSMAVQPSALEQYQKKLIPGENITIKDNVISSTGGGSATAGTDIKVENGVVSVNTTGTATGVNSFVIGGNGNEASGGQSFAGGLKAKAKGEESFAFGNELVAGGRYSEAHGYKQYSVSKADLDENGTLDGNANGYITKDIKVKWSDVKADAESINGSYQAGEGAATYGAKHVVFGARSEAHGNTNLVTGRDSVANNSNNEVYGNYAHAEGRGNQCWGNAQSVLGKYCDPKREEGVGDNSPYLEIVGNGSSTSSRSNARTLDKRGNEHLAGKVYPNNGTESYDDMIARKQDTISDLEEIRSGAAAGAAAYNKPADGIPASDLATTVQSALDKANNALTTENVGDYYGPIYLDDNNKLNVHVGTGGLHINAGGELDMDVPVSDYKGGYRGSDGDIMTLLISDDNSYVQPTSPSTIAENLAHYLVDGTTTWVESDGISVSYDHERGLKADSNGIYVDLAVAGGLDFDDAGALKIKHQVPDGGTNGQVLTISSDDIVWADIPSPIPEYTTADAGKVLAVNSTGTGLEWITLPTSN